MGMIKEDWERIYLRDEIYLKEIEFLEQEHFKYGDRKPAKIKLKIIINNET